jgi:hypothetical protein
LWMGHPTLPSTLLVPNNFPQVEALEFDTSLILVLLICGLKNHSIIGSYQWKRLNSAPSDESPTECGGYGYGGGAFPPDDHQPKVEGMNTVDSGIEEDRMAELEMVERELEGVVLARHWTGDGAVRQR